MQDTHVLRDFQRNKRLRQNALRLKAEHHKLHEAQCQQQQQPPLGLVPSGKPSVASMAPSIKDGSLCTLHEEDSAAESDSGNGGPPRVVNAAESAGLPSRPSFDRLPRKLTFGQCENKLFVEEVDDEMLTASPQPGSPLTAFPLKPQFHLGGGAPNPDENLLHLDLSKMDGGFLAPRSAPATAAVQPGGQSGPVKEKEPIIAKNSFSFALGDK